METENMIYNNNDHTNDLTLSKEQLPKTQQSIDGDSENNHEFVDDQSQPGSPRNIEDFDE